MARIWISEADARRALTHFDLGSGATAVRSIVGGQGNQSFQVTHGSKDHVLTFCIGKQRHEIHAQARLLEALAESEYPTSRVVRTADGELTVALDGYVVLLKHYIVGECPVAATRATGRASGVLLARLHQITPPEGTTVGHPYGLGHFAAIAGATEWEPFSSWLQEQREYLEPSLAECTDRALIHGDLFPDNVVMSADGTHSAIDFEEACVDWTGLDLGMALVGFSRLPTRESGWIEELLSGYGSVRECSDIGLVSVFAEYAATATAFWRFRQFEVRKREVSTSSAYSEMVELARRVHSDGLSAMA